MLPKNRRRRQGDPESRDLGLLFIYLFIRTADYLSIYLSSKPITKKRNEMICCSCSRCHNNMYPLALSILKRSYVLCVVLLIHSVFFHIHTHVYIIIYRELKNLLNHKTYTTPLHFKNCHFTPKSEPKRNKKLPICLLGGGNCPKLHGGGSPPPAKKEDKKWKF